MAKKMDPDEFFEKTVEGTDYTETITLVRPDGGELHDVQMSPVEKTSLARLFGAMPGDMIDTGDLDDDIDFDDLSPQEAQELLDENEEVAEKLSIDTDVMNEDFYGELERLCMESLSHPNFTDAEFSVLLEELSFNLTFSLGSEVMAFSMENSGDIVDFRKQ